MLSARQGRKVMEIKNEKYEFLFEHAKASFEVELERFTSAEEKAGKFISLLSIAIAAYGASVALILERYMPIDSMAEWLFVFISFLALMALASSWSLIFRSLNFIEMPRLPLDNETFNCVEENNLATIHFLMAKTCQEGTDIAREAVNSKFDLLRIAYTDIILSAWSIFVSFIVLLRIFIS